MADLDQLLPDITTAGLGRLLERPIDERPAEGLFFEFKSEWTPRHVSKTVAAFANAQGGFLLIGATERQGALVGFPGVDRAMEWPREVANNVVAHLSPLPVWEVFCVPSPENSERDVVVVKVPYSKRAPHVDTNTGRIYQRSPGGTSAPISDRASLDILVRRGQNEEAAIAARADALFATRPPHRLGATTLSVSKYQYGIVSVPVPLGAFQQRGLFTERQAGEVASRLSSASGYLSGWSNITLGENGVRFSANWGVELTLFRDGTLECFLRKEENSVAMTMLTGVAREVLAAQGNLLTPAREAHLFVRFGSIDVKLIEHGMGGAHRDAPSLWEFDALAACADPRPVVGEFERRLWRAAGRVVFDPD